MGDTKKSQKPKFPDWQVHRGYWLGGIRENTLEAFIQAKRMGADMVELDVQISREGDVHVYHDLDLKKFFHIDKPFNQMSNEDLQVLNIPRLEDVLTHPDTPEHLNIELKSIDLFPKRLTRRVCEVVLQTEHNKKILFSSFNPMCLRGVRRLAPEFPRALIVGDKPSLMNWKWRFSMAFAKPHYINAKYRLFDDEVCRQKLENEGLPLMLWTVNDLEKAQEYLSLGVKSIISDQPSPHFSP